MLSPGDSVGTVFKPILPSVTDYELEFCVRPLLKLIGIGLTGVQEKVKDGIITVGEVKSLLSDDYLDTIARDDYGDKYDEYWGILNNPELDDNKPYKEVLGDSAFVEWQSIFMNVILSDPRISARIDIEEPGCVVLTAQRKVYASKAWPEKSVVIPFIYAFNNDDIKKKWGGHTVYMNGLIKNSRLMNNNSHFHISMAPDSDVEPYDQNTTSASYNTFYASVNSDSVSYPIGYIPVKYEPSNQANIIARYDGASYESTKGRYSFLFKMNSDDSE